MPFPLHVSPQEGSSQSRWMDGPKEKPRGCPDAGDRPLCQGGSPPSTQRIPSTPQQGDFYSRTGQPGWTCPRKGRRMERDSDGDGSCLGFRRPFLSPPKVPPPPQAPSLPLPPSPPVCRPGYSHSGSADVALNIPRVPAFCPGGPASSL